MCGITGIWTTQLDAEETGRRVTSMTRMVAHRGPDDEGVDVVFAAGPIVSFGNRRLSILDLSAAGHQPMYDAATGNWITFNGEIYNFTDLRVELQQQGYQFRTKCDTEVILKAYAEWGVGCWRRLRGIFAFGLWDARYFELHLVRDHLGVKPLYYARTPQGLSFASEVRAIMASGCVDRRLSVEGLESFLKYGSVQEPCTLVSGIESLPPGNYLTCMMNGAVNVRHYWRIQECYVRNWSQPPNRDCVRTALEDTVRRQLVSDVPVGVFLSGGLDSTAIAALAAQAQPGGIRTFCIGSEDKAADESAEAAQTASYLGCKHTTLMVEGVKMPELLAMALSSYDQPSYDGINSYFISMLVRQAGIKVALSGLGGDELFIGYDGFRKGIAMDKAGQFLDLMPPSSRRAAGHMIAAISPTGSSMGGALAEILEPSLASPYFASRTLFSHWHSKQLLQNSTNFVPGDSSWERREHRLSADARAMDAVDRLSYFEMQTYMLSTLLRDSDQMSMAHGLELRVPLIDPNLLEHVFPIPVREKTTKGVSKYLLFDAVKDLIPSDVSMRRKRYFTLPFRLWLLRDLNYQVRETFHEVQLRGPWNRKAFRRVWTDFQRGRVAWSRVLTLFILENWLRQNRINA